MTKKIKIAGVCSIILLLILLSTDPQRLPSIALVLPFVLLFVVITIGLFLILGLYSVPRRAKIRISLAGAAVPVLLLILQSLGQLTVKDVFAVLVLFGAAYFYISRLGVQSAS